MKATVRIELYHENGPAVIVTHHVFNGPEKQGWAMHPGAGGIVEGDHIYFGYTIELHGKSMEAP